MQWFLLARKWFFNRKYSLYILNLFYIFLFLKVHFVSDLCYLRLETSLFPMSTMTTKMKERKKRERETKIKMSFIKTATALCLIRIHAMFKALKFLFPKECYINFIKHINYTILFEFYSAVP